MSSNNSSYSWRRDSKRTFSSLIAYTLALVFTLTLMPQQTLAASSTSWSQAGYDNVSKTWTPGNMVKYAEGDYLPYRANAEGYAPTGQDIAFDLDYLESGTGALGFDQATNWFIGPYVPYSGSPTLYTKAQIQAYAQATYGKSIIEPATQFLGPTPGSTANAFSITAPVELTAGGLPIPAGYTGDTILRYKIVPNLNGYTQGSATALPGSFINALMTYYGGSWTMYYEAHLAESGAPNLFAGGIVQRGAGAYAGSSLHVTFDRVGEKTIPLPTGGLANRDILVEKTWANIADAVPVTIKLMAQNGTGGTPYVAGTITLDGVVDTNANPEYAPWKGKFVNVPIYYYVSKVPYPIIYTVVEDPVPPGFKPPVYSGLASDVLKVHNEKNFGSLEASLDVKAQDYHNVLKQDYHNEMAQDYHNVLKQDFHNVLKQNFHNVLKQDFHNVLKQDFHNVLKQNYHNVLAQDFHNLLKQDYHNVLKQDFHNELAQDFHNVLAQDFHNLMEQDFHNVLAQDFHNVLSQDFHNVLEQDFHDVLMQDFHNVLAQDFHNELAQDYHNELAQDFHNELAQDFHNELARDFHNELAQDFHNVLKQDFYNMLKQDFHNVYVPVFEKGVSNAYGTVVSGITYGYGADGTSGLPGGYLNNGMTYLTINNIGQYTSENPLMVWIADSSPKNKKSSPTEYNKNYDYFYELYAEDNRVYIRFDDRLIEAGFGILVSDKAFTGNPASLVKHDNNPDGTPVKVDKNGNTYVFFHADGVSWYTTGEYEFVRWDFLEKVLDNDPYYFQKILDGDPYLFQKVLDGAPYFSEKILDGAPYFSAKILDGTPYFSAKILDGTPYFSEKILDGATYFSAKILDGTPYFSAKVLDGIPYFSEKILDGGPYFSEKILDGAPYFSEKILDGAPYFSAKILDGIPYFSEKILDGAPYFSEKILDGTPYFSAKILDGAPYQFEKVLDGTPYQFEKVLDGAPYFSAKILDGAPYFSEKILDGAPYQFEKVLDGIPYQFEKVLDGTPYFFEKVLDGTPYFSAKILDGTPYFFQKVLEGTPYSVSDFPGVYTLTLMKGASVIDTATLTKDNTSKLFENLQPGVYTVILSLGATEISRQDVTVNSGAKATAAFTDTIDGVQGDDVIIDGVKGADVIIDGVKGADEIIDGVKGDDVIIDGVKGDDVIVDGVQGADVTIDGEQGPDVIIDGTQGPDVYYGSTDPEDPESIDHGKYTPPRP